jgi:hypothetical protein
MGISTLIAKMMNVRTGYCHQNFLKYPKELSNSANISPEDIIS